MTLRADTDNALAVERAACDVEISTLRGENGDLNSQIASLQDELVSLSYRFAEANSQIALLRLQLAECEGAQGIPVPAGANLAAAVADAPQGATLRLAPGATYVVRSPLHMKDGQSLVGPAYIVGDGLTGDQDLLVSGEGNSYIDLDVSGAARHGLKAWIGTQVKGGRYHHNLKDGIGCDMKGLSAGIVVDGVEADANGTPEWLGLGAAGIKFFHIRDVVVRNCDVHDNYGNGVWFDTHCGDALVENNAISRNWRKGVFWEKCGESDNTFQNRGQIYTGTLTVRGNTITDNDREGKAIANGGVSMYSSKNADVYDNTFSGNGNAVIAREDEPRLTDDKHGWHLDNIRIHDNRLGGDGVIGCDKAGVTCSNNS